MKTVKLSNIIDFQFSFCKEMIDKNGEDSYFTALNEKYSILSVFDGCGGLGAKEYANFGGKTGAYMASKIAGGATEDWFLNLTPNSINPTSYKKFIDNGFNIAEKFSDKGGLVFKGSMQKTFPTTISTAVAFLKNNVINVNFLWAGDSRGYVLDEDGLHQITTDDIDGEDAMSNLSNDGVLKNVASLANDYEIHTRHIILKKPSVVFCATDGCFGYLSTPMEFEDMLLETLLLSESPNQWKQMLYDKIGLYAGDDYTMSLLAVGFNDFANLKNSMVRRKAYMYSEYMQNMENYTYEQKVELWNRYKIGYEYRV